VLPAAYTRHADWIVCAALTCLLFARIIIDDRSAPDSRHSGSLNLSAWIAAILIVIAAGLLFQRRRGVAVTVAAVSWIAIWSLIAVFSHGFATDTIREGVREVSVVAVGVIVYGLGATLSPRRAVRLVQVVVAVPAVIALYQLAAGTGMDIAGDMRANGTLAHPNSAAMVFALAAAASAWRAVEGERDRLDLLCVAFFGAATIATVSIDGVASLAVMLLTLAAFQNSLRQRILPVALAIAVVVAFFLSPLGAERVSQQSNTNLAAASRGEIDSSLDTRLYRWKTLLPIWEESPVVGGGLGTTTTAESTAENHLAGLLPHNEYIRYLVETGVVGCLILAAALIALCRTLWRHSLRSDDREPAWRSARALGFAVVIGCLLNSVADNTLLNSPTCYVAAVLVAAVLACRNTPRELDPLRSDATV
jgi:O-antigen ligase